MKRRGVLPPSHLPTRPPLLTTLALDVYAAPGWAFGVTWTLLGGLWLFWAYDLARQRGKPLPGYGERQE